MLRMLERFKTRRNEQLPASAAAMLGDLFLDDRHVPHADAWLGESPQWMKPAELDAQFPRPPDLEELMAAPPQRCSGNESCC